MRATPKRFIKTVFVGSLTCFVVINLNLFLQAGPDTYAGAVSEVDPPLSPQQQNGVIHLPHLPHPPQTSNPVIQTNNSSSKDQENPPHLNDQGAAKLLPPVDDTQVEVNDRHINSYPPEMRDGRDRVYRPVLNSSTTGLRYNLTNAEILRWKAYIKDANTRQHVYNLDQFDLQGSETTIVVVVQVHNRRDYLTHLIDSLRKATDIQQTLLIFSHDFFDDDINKLVQEIDFCPVMQIYYPVAMQLHPGQFPGESPEDCSRNVNREEAKKLGCVNADHPDKYGHYREAKYTQTKHHWFWKINHVFDHLDVTKNFNGPVIFVEEDHYMVEDFIPVLRTMYRFREQSCKDCHIFTLGAYDKKPQYHASSNKGLFERIFGAKKDEKDLLVDKVDIMPWVSSKHNMGMSLNRAIWEKIKPCAQKFCEFDDYNWDWSLQFIGMNCLKERLKVMVMKSPRIFHIGECGVHHKGKNCNPALKVAQLETLIQGNKERLYPSQLSIFGYPRVPNRMPKPNGGWGDARDHNLCLSFTRPERHR